MAEKKMSKKELKQWQKKMVKRYETLIQKIEKKEGFLKASLIALHIKKGLKDGLPFESMIEYAEELFEEECSDAKDTIEKGSKNKAV